MRIQVAALGPLQADWKPGDAVEAQINKTDRNDACRMAQMMRLGFVAW